MPPNITTSEIFAVLTYLLPGLVAASTFYALASHPKPNVFERIVQALIFTVLAQLVADQMPFISKSAAAELSPPDSLRTIAAVFFAIILAVLTAYVSNKDILHSRLRRLGVTKETSHPSEWHSVFARKDPRYVVLHLSDRRRLYGWPEERPGRSDQGHFRLAEPKWLDENNKPMKSEVVDMLIPADQVTMVEFLPEHQTEKGE